MYTVLNGISKLNGYLFMILNFNLKKKIILPPSMKNRTYCEMARVLMWNWQSKKEVVLVKSGVHIKSKRE